MEFYGILCQIFNILWSIHGDCGIYTQPNATNRSRLWGWTMAETSSRLVVIYCSSHGLGHLTRCIEVARALKGMGHRVTFVTSMKNCEKLGGSNLSLVDGGFTFNIRDKSLDSGAVQRDAFSVDVAATLDSYKRIHEIAETLCLEERDWLVATKADAVISDVVPIAFRAADMANIPSICMSNFTWDYIYKSFGETALGTCADMISKIEQDYTKASLYLRLPGSCPCADTLNDLSIDIPMVVRLQRQSVSMVKDLMNVPDSANICLVMLGGHELGIDDFSLDDLLLPKDWICLVTPSIVKYGTNSNVPKNIRVIPAHAYIPDFVACADVVVGKIGYGAVSECIAHKTPLVYVRRDNFAEESGLIGFLKNRNAGFEISLATFLSRNWCAFLEQAKSLEVGSSDLNGSSIVCQIVSDIIDIHATLRTRNMSLAKMHQFLRDGSHSYWGFVRQILLSLNENMSMSRGDPILFSKAPGRLDVMGGISDYSGSHVLEMPLSAGTLVATQVSTSKISPKSATGRIIVNIFSPSSDSTDRSNFTSIDLSNLLEIEENGSTKPKEFKLIKAFLHKNTKDRWAAFVVGAFPVLARFQSYVIGKNVQSITMIVGSAGLKEGAGVSSSASLEVACILAIAKAFNIRLEGYQAPILAQIVENEIVGACCGIMDQITSFLGQDNKFISIACTDPFCVRDFIQIPPNIKFWGIDSGVKRSTSSSTYTSCRIAAFMGKKIINEDCAGRIKHLAELEPAEFESEHQQKLPDFMTGSEFIARYGTHDDPVTEIDPTKVYNIKVCATHPVWENQRTKTFGNILQACGGELSLEECRLLGNLMCESHISYSECGLGSPETDILFHLARKTDGVYGARITGGGGGGTVCLLTLDNPGGKEAVQAIQREYESRTGIMSTLFHGSSDGAHIFGVVRLDFPSTLVANS